MDCAASGVPNLEIVAPKRTFENVLIQVDWHDHLAAHRRPGQWVAVGECFRPRRFKSTGVQYRCTSAGVTSGVPSERIRWPRTGSVQDGTVVWLAEPVAGTSLRTTVATDTWVVPSGLVHGVETESDLIYAVLVDGGVSGATYDIAHQIILANGEEAEQVVRLTVQD